MSDQQYLVFDHFTDPVYWIAHDAPTIKRLVDIGGYDLVFDRAGVAVLAKRRR